MGSDGRKAVVRDGKFWRKSDGRWISKFYCRHCRKHFSNATFAPEYRQNKRHKNKYVLKGLVERGSLRGIARRENLSRTTVARKLRFLGARSAVELEELNRRLPPVAKLQFDDQETAEHSKYKPVAISLAVVAGSRWILGFEISRMPVKWKLSPAKKLKYGNRPDDRGKGRKRLFSRICKYCRPDVEISSDEQPHYPRDIRTFFPAGVHVQHPSRRPIANGQDELKKGWDPLFSLNHTCAMNRDRMARLTRKSWCVSKKRESLSDHLAVWAVHHNKSLPIFRDLSSA